MDTCYSTISFSLCIVPIKHSDTSLNLIWMKLIILNLEVWMVCRVHVHIKMMSSVIICYVTCFQQSVPFNCGRWSDLGTFNQHCLLEILENFLIFTIEKNINIFIFQIERALNWFGMNWTFTRVALLEDAECRKVKYLVLDHFPKPENF